jgi:hypothetical protein
MSLAIWWSDTAMLSTSAVGALWPRLPTNCCVPVSEVIGRGALALRRREFMARRHGRLPRPAQQLRRIGERREYRIAVHRIDEVQRDVDQSGHARCGPQRIHAVEKVNGELYNVEFAAVEAVQDPTKATKK